MKFWAVAYKYQEDVYFDLEAEDTTMDLSEKCLLPTKVLPEKLIDGDTDFVPVDVEIESLSKQGVMVWGRGEVSEWDDNFWEEEE